MNWIKLKNIFNPKDSDNWKDTWGTIDWKNDSEKEILQKIRDFYSAGVDFNMRYGSKTPLMYAAVGASKNVVALLTDGGADVNLKDINGMTALYYAAISDNAEVVQCLIERSPRNFENKKDNNGATALHDAASYGSLNAVKVLLVCGADVNAVRKDKETPLHRAVKNGLPEVAKVLIERGADLSAKDMYGNTPVDYAYRYLEEEDDCLVLDLERREKTLEVIKKANQIRAEYVRKHLEGSLRKTLANASLSSKIKSFFKGIKTR